MRTKFMITYKRKRISSQSHISDGAVADSFPGASSSVATKNLNPKCEAETKNKKLNGDDLCALEDSQSTSCAKQQDVYEPMQQETDKERAKLCTNKSEKEQMDCQSCKLSPSTRQFGEYFSNRSLSTIVAPKNKLDDDIKADSTILACNSVSELMSTKGIRCQREDSDDCAPVGIDINERPNVTEKRREHNNCSLLITFHRRVKTKYNSAEPFNGKHSKANDKQAGGSSLDTLHQDEMATVGTSTGFASVPAECLLEPKNQNSPDQHPVPSQPAEDVHGKLSENHVAAPSSELTRELHFVHEIIQSAATAEGSTKTSPDAVNELNKLNTRENVLVKRGELGNQQPFAPCSPSHKAKMDWRKPTNEGTVEDLLESQGSTKSCPVILVDDEADVRGKELELAEIPDQTRQKKNANRFLLEQINLNCAELPKLRWPSLANSTVQRLQSKDASASPVNQMPFPIERMLFTKENDMLSYKQEHEGASTMPTMYTNFFDPSLPCNAEGPGLSSKEPRIMSSGLDFRVQDGFRDNNLDLCLDSNPDSSVSGTRHKWILGSSSSGPLMLSERLGASTYKRHSPYWSEEELDFLWIGVRRYGINNWNVMLGDPRLQFSDSRIPDDLAKQWEKEQRKLVSGNLFQPRRMSKLDALPSTLTAEDCTGGGTCSGCLKFPFLSSQTELSLGDVYVSRISERSQRHSSSLGIHSRQGSEDAPRNLSLGDFPVVSSYMRAATRRQRTCKMQNSYYDNKSSWLQESTERLSQLHPSSQQASCILPHWLRNAVDTPVSQGDSEMWSTISAARHHADLINDGLRAGPTFPSDVNPPALPKASRKRGILKRRAGRRTFNKTIFGPNSALDLNKHAAAVVGSSGAAVSDSGASSEETVSDG